MLFCWWLVRLPFIKRAGLNRQTVILLFLLKIAAGVSIGWLSVHYYSTGNDYWDVNREGWKEYRLFWTDPKEYFSNIFHSGYSNGYAGIFDSFQSFWNDLKNNLVIKMVSVFDFFSGGNYYINSLFFNFFIFFGHVALYRVFIKIYQGQAFRVIIGCFLLPSMLYFTSGIHKDGIVFWMLALFIYALYFSLTETRVSVKRIVVLLISLLLLFFTRNFVLIALIPALTAWVVSVKMKWPVILTFAGVYVVSGLLFFNLHAFFPAFDPLGSIVQKQSDFLVLPHAVTGIDLDPLHPGFMSFLHNAPQAFNHLLIRPYLTELPSPILLPANIELLLYQLLFVLFLFFQRKKEPFNKEPMIVFAVFFTLTAFLFIGYIVPNLGSLVRYRSLYLPFLVTPLLCQTNWKKVQYLIKIK